MKAERASSSSSGVSRKDAVVGATAAGAFLLGAGALSFPGAANAEFTPSQRKQQYFRCVCTHTNTAISMH